YCRVALSVTSEVPSSPGATGIPSELEGHYYQNRLRVRFVGDIEQRYRRYCARRDRRYIGNLLNILIILYISYGLFDWYLLRELATPLWAVRYGLGLPGLMLAWLVTRLPRAERYLDRMVVVTLGWLTVTTLLMTRLVPPDEMDLYMSSTLAIGMTGMTITRLSFWNAVVTAVIFLVAVGLLLPGVHINSHFVVYYMVLCAGIAMFCLIAQFIADQSRRREFLQKIIIHRKNQQLRKLNLYLR